MSELIQTIIELYLLSPIPLKVAYGFWFGFILLYWYASLHDKYNVKPKERNKTKRNFSLTLVALGLVFVVFYHSSILLGWDVQLKLFLIFPPSLFITGVIFMMIGLWLIGLSRAALNGYWGPHIYDYPNDNKLIDIGVYSRLRHPVYLAQVLMAFGTALLSNSMIVFLFPICLAYANIKRARREDVDLEKRFQADFTDYKNKVDLIIPGLF